MGNGCLYERYITMATAYMGWLVWTLLLEKVQICTKTISLSKPGDAYWVQIYDFMRLLFTPCATVDPCSLVVQCSVLLHD